MPFFQKNVKIRHFCRETLTYDVFGPIILDQVPGEFFYRHIYAWRRGRILIMPDWNIGTLKHLNIRTQSASCDLSCIDTV